MIMSAKNLKLEPHNEIIYKSVSDIILCNKRAVLLQVDGSHRESVVLSIINDYKDEVIKCFLFDDCSFKDEILSNYNTYNIEFIDYKEFLNMSRDQISSLEVSFAIFDNCSFTSFPEIDSRVKLLLDTHFNLKVLGVNSILINDSFNEGVLSQSKKHIFNLVDALSLGIFKFPRYVTMIKDLALNVDDLYEKIRKRSLVNRDYDNYLAILFGVKNKVNDISFYDNFKSIVNKGKYIYFCTDLVISEELKNSFSGANIYSFDEVSEFLTDDGFSVLVSSENIIVNNLDGIIFGSSFDNFMEKFSSVLSFYKDIIDDNFLFIDFYNNIKDIKFLIDCILKKNGELVLNFEINDKDIIEMLDYVTGFYNNKRLGYLERCTELLEIVKKEEFAKLIDINFSDGVNMDSWWNENRRKVLKDDNSISKEISKLYKKRETLSFEDKKYLFLNYIKEKDIPKIKDNICFSDEVNMGAWWISNKKNIFILDDDVSLDIINIVKDRYGDC